jgi:hypothetical protein
VRPLLSPAIASTVLAACSGGSWRCFRSRVLLRSRYNRHDRRDHTHAPPYPDHGQSSCSLQRARDANTSASPRVERPGQLERERASGARTGHGEESVPATRVMLERVSLCPLHTSRVRGPFAVARGAAAFSDECQRDTLAIRRVTRFAMHERYRCEASVVSRRSSVPSSAGTSHSRARRGHSGGASQPRRGDPRYRGEIEAQ